MTNPHHPCGPSTLARREACPGSLAAELPLWDEPQTEDEHTRRGTLRHKAAYEGLLRRARRPELLAEISDPADREIVEAWWAFWTHALDSYGLCLWADAEVRVTLPFDRWGSVDGAALFDMHGDTVLVVADLKGQPQVRPSRNLQLLDYASGLIGRLSLMEKPQPTSIVLAIVSRAGVDRETLSNADLLNAIDRVGKVVQRCQDPNAPRIAGPHCAYCLKQDTCDTRAQVAAEVVAYRNLQRSPVEVMRGLTNADRTRVLDDLNLAVKRLEQVKEEVKEAIRKGELTVPGYRVCKTERKQWKNEDTARAMLCAIAENHGLRREDMTKLISPIEATRLVGKDSVDPLIESVPGTPQVRRAKDAQEE